MSFEVEQALRAELSPGEDLLWSARPVQGVRFRTGDFLFVPFSLMAAVFAIFWEYVAVAQERPLFLAIWGLPFVLMGFYITVGRFFVDSAARSRTYYGLTDQRAIILHGFFRRTVKSVALQGLQEMSLHERADHGGTITLGREPAVFATWAGAGWPNSGKLPPTFELAEDARKVHDLIRATQRSAAKS
jgi:hypothetical protein